MPRGQQLDVLPSLQDALQHQLAIAPPVYRPLVWRPLLVPNVDEWQPGDIVLVMRSGASGMVLGPGQVLIGPAPANTRDWSHCAIYAGEGFVVDAMPRGGVQVRSLFEYCEKRATALLRLEINGAWLNEAQGREIVRKARTLVDTPYAFGNLIRLALARLAQMLRGKPTGGTSAPPKASRLFCSSLVVVAYNAINIQLEQDPDVAPCLPANLPSHASLWSQGTHWHEGTV
jgi:hypothetical protein